MSSIAQKFYNLKTSVGGNREKNIFEYTVGIPMIEKAGISRPSRANNRILAELEFSLHLSEANAGVFDEVVEAALDYLLEEIKNNGVLTDSACEKAEEILAPLHAAAKEYKLILAAHAHIDMNWMWSYDETVAITLATFRSILNIMNEYPTFCFSQSQASVYKIVEEFDPQMMEEIRKRIDEGRWEITATAWVETDKNMPSGESLLRHIQYTREYLTEVWGAKRLDIDFSPDTFGHSANIPEIDTYGDIKYYYHCRGKDTKQVLYRYRALSGKEILVHREPLWYNSGITPEIGTTAIEISQYSGGCKTGLVVYGVGDHGGGPTRRDVERALEMMTWKIFPDIRFGTLHEYFDEAAKVWDKLPIVTKEMNCIFPGCYSTQSRIKRGNRRAEARLYDAESISCIAAKLTGFNYAEEQMKEAWQNVLFTHFHDILTGSCVRDSREYAMSLYQKSAAIANTQIQNAMRSISQKIDTSAISVDIDAYNSQSEGAGVGYGIENFVGVPSTERGSGRTRIFHIFNTLPFGREENVELTVWDWTGDMSRIGMKDEQGNTIAFQLLDNKQTWYWDHQYFKLVANVTVPSTGYATVVLFEKESESYPVLLNEYLPDRIGCTFDDHILENEHIFARISKKTGRLVTLVDKTSKEELIASETGAGFTYIETEAATSNAWKIGRHLGEEPLSQCIELTLIENGELRKSVKAKYKIKDSELEVIYSLDKNAKVVKLKTKIDWREHGVGKDTVPVLDYRVPLAFNADEYMYDIPAGAIRRSKQNNDVPGQEYGMALNKSGKSNLILISDCKYGYRGTGDAFALTLINSATDPDPYPERGIHDITLWLGAASPNEKEAKEQALVCNHNLFYQPSNCHNGLLPTKNSVMQFICENAVVSAIIPNAEKSLLVRLYETEGKKALAKFVFNKKVESAEAVKLSGQPALNKVEFAENTVTLSVEPHSIAAIKVRLK